MRHLTRLILLCVVAVPAGSCFGADASLWVDAPAVPCLAFAIGKLNAALAEAGMNVSESAGTTIRVLVDPSRITTETARKPEGFQLIAAPEGIVVAGYDAPGLMYGCLELARRVRDAGKLPENLDIAEAPGMSLRGTCILLMKLGLYDYPVTPAEFPFFYDKALWTEYLDFLADNRFNYIAFWNGHPFDYFVKLEKYPEAQDGLDAGLLERNHEMLMWLGREAEKRNIWLMFEFYNIHVSVYFAKAHKLPEHGIDKPTQLLSDYTGYCIERFVSEFPSVGLYICPGESLKLEYTPDWINNVIFGAVKRTGKTPPIMIRSWGIDLEHMKRVVSNYPRLYTERKFNVEMIASTDIDPENADWAKLSGNHVVNIHCMGNLEPFRWSPPSYIQRCIQNSLKAGATGLHLYPRKAWRWPYGCDKTDRPEFQWHRDWMWFEAWGRYAWNANRDAKSERAYWLDRLAKRFGQNAGAHVLNAYEVSADVLPGIQRLFWIGNDNHTVVGAGALLGQLQTAKGIPFLDLPDVTRIPDYIEAAKAGKKLAGDPVAFLANKTKDARRAVWEAVSANALTEERNEEVQRIKSDMQAVAFIADFYHHKLQAAISKALVDAGVDVSKNTKACAKYLSASVNDFRCLTDLTRDTYESLSDVPAWIPVKSLPCPYHWSDVLPLFEDELAKIINELTKKTDDAAALELLADAAYLDGYAPAGMDATVPDVTSNLVLSLAANYQRQLPRPADLDARKRVIRSRLLRSYGLEPMPERAPLNARTVGRVEYPEYVIDKVVYEAWPGIPVSAHLYLPKNADAPLPCVLYTCGHWYHGKTEGDPRSFCAGMVQKGVAVLIYDPMGQGERYAEGEHGHLFPILAGLSQEGFMVWESMRAIDYLETRPEIDAKRIGLTGASGGGLNTLFTTAVEDRLAAAAPVCYPVTYMDFLCAMAGRNWNGGMDLCNQVSGVITFARTSDLMALMAPKPLLQISATEDVDFPISGARQTAQEVTAAYREAKAEQNFNYVEVEAPHGYDKAMREAAYGFFLKALAREGDGGPSPEPSMDLEPWDDPKLRCFSDGENHVAGPLMEPLVRSMLPDTPELGALPAKEDLPQWQEMLRTRIREICAVPVLGESALSPFPTRTLAGGVSVSGLSVIGKERVTGPAAQGEGLECSHFSSMIALAGKPEKSPIACILLSRRSSQETLTSSLARGLAEAGALVCIPRLTGLEEDSPKEFELATNLWMLNRTLIGEWLCEIESLVSHIASETSGNQVCLVGMDAMAETALLAAAMIPGVGSVIVDQPLVTYHDLVSHKVRWSASAYLPRVLQSVDLAQVIAAIAPRKVLLFNPINGFREPYRAEDLHRVYAFARSVYETLGVPDAFQAVTDKPFDARSVLDCAGSEK